MKSSWRNFDVAGTGAAFQAPAVKAKPRNFMVIDGLDGVVTDPTRR